MSQGAGSTPSRPSTPSLAERVRFQPYLNGFYDVARQWPDHILRRIEAACERAANRRAALRTPHDVLAYQQLVRERFWASMGGPIVTSGDGSYEVTGELTHLGVGITKLVFESHPGVPVSALLFRPPASTGAPSASGMGGGGEMQAGGDAGTGGTAGKRPAVLFLSGHHETAKHHPEYQRICFDLALHGFVVLAVDPWGQGERFQYYDAESLNPVNPDAPLVATGTYEHSYCGLQCFLAGDAVARYFAWDAVRGVDILASLPDVDPARIGVTGNSGGGTQTTLLMLADTRIAAAAPCTYISSTATYFRAGLPHDGEQNFVGSLAGGLEQTDFLASFAPKPLLIGAVAYDFFPLEATQRTVEAARQVYDVFGAGDQIQLAVDADRHWYTDPLREAAVRFFTAKLAGGERYERQDIQTLEPDKLWCSPAGQLYRDRVGSAGSAGSVGGIGGGSGGTPGPRTVFDLNREFLAARRRSAPKTAEDARARLVAALVWPVLPESLPINPRYFPATQGDGFEVQRFFFFAEPEVAVSGAMLRPEKVAADGRTWLVVLPDGTGSDDGAMSGVLDLVRRGHRVCLFDVRGRGGVESYPTQGRGVNAILGFEAYNNYLEMLFDTSTVSSRAFDVARAAEFLVRNEASSGGLALRAHGDAALWSYLAAALDERFQEVQLSGMLPSWSEIVNTRLYDSRRINASIAIPGVLRHFDLPDLEVCFRGRALSINSPLPVAVDPASLPITR
jgi:cephalosporin-C deacetylase-like acetyl esterase